MEKINIILSNSHVNNKLEITTYALINLLQDVEGIHINSLKEFTKYFNEHNMGIFLMYRQIDILDKPKFGDEVVLDTYPFETTPISGYRHIYLDDIKGNRLVKTTSFGAFVNLETLKPTRLPKEYKKWIKDGIKDPSINLLSRKIVSNENELRLIEKVVVRKNHIDRYNHLNNAHYISFVLNNMDDYEFNRIRAEYKNSFLLDEVIYIYEDISSEDKTFVLKNEQDEIYTIIEFSLTNLS